jgi:glc operon protein GlcG
VAALIAQFDSRAQDRKVDSGIQGDNRVRSGESTGKLVSEVRDMAGLFGAGAITASERRLRTIEKETQVATRIETVDSLRGELVDAVASKLARLSGIQGIFVLIARRETKIEVLVSHRFAAALPRSRVDAIRSAFIEAFRRHEFNEGLTRGVDAIQAEVQAAARGGQLPKLPATSVPVEVERSMPSSLGASTDNQALILQNQARLTLVGARTMIASAQAKARSMNLKVNIAVVDDGGHLLAFERMDGARPASAYTAMTKATTAATFRQPTGPLPAGASEPDVLLNLSLQNAAQASGGKLTTLHGGIPVEFNGQVIGGIGVGGGTGEQDADIARAGAQVIREKVANPAK